MTLHYLFGGVALNTNFTSDEKQEFFFSKGHNTKQLA